MPSVPEGSVEPGSHSSWKRPPRSPSSAQPSPPCPPGDALHTEQPTERGVNREGTGSAPPRAASRGGFGQHQRCSQPPVGTQSSARSIPRRRSLFWEMSKICSLVLCMTRIVNPSRRCFGLEIAITVTQPSGYKKRHDST